MLENHDDNDECDDDVVRLLRLEFDELGELLLDALLSDADDEDVELDDRELVDELS
jgi:hypothetical protein